MPQPQVRQGGKKNRKYGRNKPKCQRYRDHHVRERNKLKRIRRSCGLAFAIRWAKERGVLSLLPA